jgi:hypothetical protein
MFIKVSIRARHWSHPELVSSHAYPFPLKCVLILSYRPPLGHAVLVFSFNHVYGIFGLKVRLLLDYLMVPCLDIHSMQLQTETLSWL